MKRKLIILSIGILVAYIIGGLLLYSFQESFIFPATKLNPNYKFRFDNEFEEINIQTDDDINLNAILFKNPNSKGVVLYFHGNGGTIQGWGHQANSFIVAGHDILFLDYRGYGKSEGKIQSEAQLLEDAQKVYDYLKVTYPENTIVLCGTSIGTGIATYLASNNNPNSLILNSPYYSLISLIKQKTKILPLPLLNLH